MDQLSNVSQLEWAHTTSKVGIQLYRFFVFTNQPTIVAPGWTKVSIVDQESHDIPSPTRGKQQGSNKLLRSMIIQSRWPKFQAHHHNTIQNHCQVVFYVDAITELIGTANQFQQEAHRIVTSTVGLAQYRHPYHYRQKNATMEQQQQGDNDNVGNDTSSTSTALMDEFQLVLSSKKDTPRHMNAAKQWLQDQPDFQPNCTMYENRYIGYDIHSTAFVQASDYFWSQYRVAEEEGGYSSWRDQPLWCYVLDHFNVQPIHLRHRPLLRYNLSRMGNHQHTYVNNRSE
jgi:hypothetical protein